jgi:hypothetical protein
MSYHVRLKLPTNHKIDGDDFYVAIHASLIRIQEQAAPEKRLALFVLQARLAAEEIDVRRQQAIDGLWWVAERTGLVARHGPDVVQAALVEAWS